MCKVAGTFLMCDLQHLQSGWHLYDVWSATVQWAAHRLCRKGPRTYSDAETLSEVLSPHDERLLTSSKVAGTL